MFLFGIVCLTGRLLQFLLLFWRKEPEREPDYEPSFMEQYGFDFLMGVIVWFGMFFWLYDGKKPV